MKGQWIGEFRGTNAGTVVLDLDEDKGGYDALLSVYDLNPAYPRTFSRFWLPKGDAHYSQRISLDHLEMGTGAVLSDQDIKTKYPSIHMPRVADIEWKISSDEIDVKWKTPITSGLAKLFPDKMGMSSSIVPRADVADWNEFKQFASSLEPYEYAFRGHADCAWRLRTSFHRTGRANLVRFSTEDMAALNRHLVGLTTSRFNLSDGSDYAAFLSLVQHHGYPTPGLDWTQSPFVAAYFAFKDIRSKDVRPDQKVRILILEAKKWNLLNRGAFLMPGFLHMTLVEPLALNNTRALPQQSLFGFTNISDLETYLEHAGRLKGISYLTAIDLPVSERKSVMQDLALMGITAGSLFPGLDGACQQLKERFFEL